MLTQRLMEGSELYEEQRFLEQDYIERGIQRYRRQANDAIERGEGSKLKTCDRLMSWWYPRLLEKIKAEGRSIRRGEPGQGRSFYGETFLRSSPQRMSVITLHAIISQLLKEPNGVTRTSLVYVIGRNVLTDLLYERMRKEARDDFKDLNVRWKRLNDKRILAASRRTFEEEEVYRKRVCIHLGAVLLKHALSVMVVPMGDDKHAPAWVSFLRKAKSRTVMRCYQPSDEFLGWLDGETMARSTLRPVRGFMVVPPMAWAQGDDGVIEGGYLTIGCPFVTGPTVRQKRTLKDADLSRQMEAMNSLGRVPWTINDRVLEVAQAVWECGGGDLGMPRANDPPKPPYPEDGASESVIKAWKKKAVEWRRDKIRAVGDRFELFQKLSIAERWKGRTFYQPHHMDFRGRCYPAPTFLNHQGDDLCRGLMTFAEERPFNWYWASVEAANAWGYDKGPFEAREDWVRDNWAEIKRSATEPMECDFWRSADDPWQFLAACFALVHEDGRLPIKMDGSANGLQHYAALGRDTVAAPHLNLIDGPKPGDLYTVVLERLLPEVSGRDRELLSRSVVKQPVMTLPYGVTAYGMRDQIAEKLMETGMKKEAAYEVGHRIQPKVRAAIGDTVKSAFEIMDWLEKCAALVAKDSGFVRWESPLGLPIIQPYEQNRRREERTALCSVWTRSDDGTDPPMPYRQVAGIAPNFVHSLDAAHMLMVSQRMSDEGLAFAEVHDSYWTHSSDVDRMNRILREEFVGLHSQPLLERLRADLQCECNRSLPLPPGKGELDLLDVLDSTYFFN